MAGFFRIFVMFLYFLRVFIDLFSSDFYFQIYSDRFILVFNVLCSICMCVFNKVYVLQIFNFIACPAWVIFMYSPPLLDHWTLKSQNSALGL